jgi:NADH-quinone oxidoreductase subunit J
MTILQIIFLVTAIVITVAALMVVASPNLVHAALWLILTLAGVAVVFVLLEASFLAVVQVAVYIDAIAILFGGLALLLTQVQGLPTEPPDISDLAEPTLDALGKALVDVDQYVIAFEVASVLLLAALIGAIFVARPTAESGGEG